MNHIIGNEKSMFRNGVVAWPMHIPICTKWNSLHLPQLQFLPSQARWVDGLCEKVCAANQFKSLTSLVQRAPANCLLPCCTRADTSYTRTSHYWNDTTRRVQHSDENRRQSVFVWRTAVLSIYESSSLQLVQPWDSGPTSSGSTKYSAAGNNSTKHRQPFYYISIYRVQ